MRFTITQFNNRFPDELACLEEIKQIRYPQGITCRKCNLVTPHFKVRGRKCYACSVCLRQTYPLVGTIFHGSCTDLTLWFYAMFLITSTRSGISAKQLEREIGVTYKTAWRMMKQIRTLMAERGMLSGDVEVDETFFKAKTYRNTRLPYMGAGTAGAEILIGMTERGGKIIVRHIEGTGSPTIKHVLLETVKISSHIHTDNAPHYIQVTKLGYKHTATQHYKGRFKPGHGNFMPTKGQSTQYIENFWSQLKRGIYGVYRHCAPKYLESYANEYAWRYSNRHSNFPLFDILIKKINKQ